MTNCDVFNTVDFGKGPVEIRCTETGPHHDHYCHVMLSTSNLVEHARRELALAGNDEEFNQSILRAVAAFASFGHSGGSASIAIPMLNDLLQYKNLTPLTDDSKEWMQVEMGNVPCWQNKRNPEAFSYDHGRTYYLLSEVEYNEPKKFHESKKHGYVVSDEYEPTKEV